MAPHLDSPQALQKNVEETAQAVPVCPACSGPTVEQGNLVRCIRCSFTWCEGCSGHGVNGDFCDPRF